MAAARLLSRQASDDKDAGEELLDLLKNPFAGQVCCCGPGGFRDTCYPIR